MPVVQSAESFYQGGNTERIANEVIGAIGDTAVTFLPAPVQPFAHELVDVLSPVIAGAVFGSREEEE